MIRKSLIALSIVAVALVSITLIATRDSAISEIVGKGLKVTTITVNNAKVYIVERDGKQLMIDSGNPGDEEKIEAYMREVNIDPSNIDYLILTHGHLDHLGTASYFQSQYGVQVIAGRGDTEMLSKGVQQPLCATSLLAKAIDMSLRGKTYPLLKADILIDRPFDLANLGMEGRIIPMPGHTQGTLLVGFDDIIFVGDLIRGELIRQRTPTRHFFMCDLEDNDEDIREVLALSQYTQWYTGHFGTLRAADIAKVWQGK